MTQSITVSPKAELHCHLEGAVRTATIIDIAREYGLELPAYDVAGLDPHVKVYAQLKDLGAVLDAFGIAQRSIASPAVVERIAGELFEDANAQNIKLLEVRFSPDWAFSGHRLDWDAALEGILRAKRRAAARFGMAIGLIAITSRGHGTQLVREDCGLGHPLERPRRTAWTWPMARAEAYPIKDFVRPMLRAKEAGLKVTVHSGEDTPASAVVDTIRAINPDRIGHGTHIIEDRAAVELVKSAGSRWRCVPWSNYLTSSVKRIEDHPLKRLFDRGVKVTISSDDPELLDTNLNNEYRIAHEILGMSMTQIAACNRHAVAASFIPEAEKRAVAERY